MMVDKVSSEFLALRRRNFGDIRNSLLVLSLPNTTTTNSAVCLRTVPTLLPCRRCVSTTVTLLWIAKSAGVSDDRFDAYEFEDLLFCELVGRGSDSISFSVDDVSPATSARKRGFICVVSFVLSSLKKTKHFVSF